MLEHVFAHLIKSGWVLAPLLAVSLLGWFLVFQRFLVLRRLDGGSAQIWRAHLAAGDWPAWLETLPERHRNSVSCEALSAVFRARHGGRTAMEEALDEVMKFRIPELERYLSTLAILATAAPLMGLLGTVAGMVKTFQVISAFGTGNQALMSDGIAEALTATQNGLLVAFPLMLMQVSLASRAEAVERNALAAARSLMNLCGAGPAR